MTQDTGEQTRESNAPSCCPTVSMSCCSSANADCCSSMNMSCCSSANAGGTAPKADAEDAGCC